MGNKYIQIAHKFYLHKPWGWIPIFPHCWAVGRELRKKLLVYFPMTILPLFSLHYCRQKKVPSRVLFFTFRYGQCDVSSCHWLRLPVQPPFPLLPFVLPEVQMWWLELQQPSKSQRPQLWHLGGVALRTVSIYLPTSQCVRKISPVYASPIRQVSVPDDMRHLLPWASMCAENPTMCFGALACVACKSGS